MFVCKFVFNYYLSIAAAYWSTFVTRLMPNNLETYLIIGASKKAVLYT